MQILKASETPNYQSKRYVVQCNVSRSQRRNEWFDWSQTNNIDSALKDCNYLIDGNHYRATHVRIIDTKE